MSFGEKLKELRKEKKYHKANQLQTLEEAKQAIVTGKKTTQNQILKQ